MTLSNTTTKPASFAYRPDIDGLRAVAVIAVVLFHLGITQLEGGFLGVDIFFVISGFLITSIIAPKIMAGSFSFKAFYLGRIRRLIPPALATVAFTFLASAIILDPSDLIAMAKSAIAAVFSLSNILFFSEAGYWDAQSELKPLLHTWSLGVEEQFYIFWPLLVLVFWKLSPKRSLVWAFGLATVIGLFVSEWILRVNPSAAFYLLPARFFEFSLGATFAFIAKSILWQRIAGGHARFILGIMGLVVLLATIWLYKGETPFPGINAVLPCLAAGALLMSGSGAGPANIVGRLLSHSVMTWLGRVSYSLYLVHWPVVSLMRYKVGLELHLHHQIIAAALMAVLTLVLYYGVEARVSARAGQSAKFNRQETVAKTRPRMANGPFAIRTGIIAVALSAVFAHAAMNSGWTWRQPNISLTPEQIDAGMKKRFILSRDTCKIMDFPRGKNCDPNKTLSVLVIGNSHEADGLNFLEGGFGTNANLQLIMFGETNRCDMLKIESGLWVSKKPKCRARFVKLQSSEFANNIDVVAYSGNKPFLSNKDHILDILTHMRRNNLDLKIVTFGGYINTKVGCSKLINETVTTSACSLPENVNYHPDMDVKQKFYEPLNEISNVVINYGDLLCIGDIPRTCETKTPEGIPMMYDTHHKSFEFAQYAGKKFASQNPGFFQKLISQK